MITLHQYIAQLRKIIIKKPNQLLSVDFNATGVYCVRLKKTGENLSVVAVDVLPPVEITKEVMDASEKSSLFHLPKNLVTRYVSICIPADEAIVKLLNLPGQLDDNVQARIKEQLGIEKGNYRIGYRVLNAGHGRSETKLLTVAIPDALVQTVCAMFPTGVPAPLSIELAGLAAMTSFINVAETNNWDEGVGVIELGVQQTFLAFFFKKELILIRKFDFGTYLFLDTIQQNLGVDQAIAQNIISERSLDISQLIRGVSESFIKQLIISRHFVERRENCRISQLFVTAGASKDWLNEINSAMGLEVKSWNPFDGLAMMPSAFPEQFDGQQSGFSAALGAGLGVMEEPVISRKGQL